MRIAIVSKSGPGGGGAGRVANELARGLRARGHAVDRIVAWPPTLQRDGEDYHGLHGPVSTRLARFARGLGLQEIVPVEYPGLRAKTRKYDLVHFHDLTWAVSPLSVAFLSLTTPVAWTLHDCSPFTGGCIQPLECPRLERGCGRCPGRGTWPLTGSLDATRPARSVKSLAARMGRFAVLAPSNWLADMAAASGLFPDVRVVSNPVDLEVFRPPSGPDERDADRSALGLPLDRPVLSFVAGSLADPWKGTDQAARVLRMLRTVGSRGAVLCLAGKADQSVRRMFSGLDAVFLDQVVGPEAMARVYRAADAHLCCSAAESFCLGAAEAMACGRPVAAFAAGALPEAIEHGRTGFLAPPGDAAGLARDLAGAMAAGELEAMGPRARQAAASRCDPEAFISAHESLYADISARYKARRGGGQGVTVAGEPE